ncbi:stomatin-related protein [Echinococcus granulosus]|uniref:Stomatin-related protein n=1 Tax=Echinococcus granulosus TaxID=6210 RepID=W6UE62_ECHGR|nr:stomatin-related protein [Echinococcus granulosus]EUB59348.1 stomatin-related protein [Echinococcus granulosus]
MPLEKHVPPRKPGFTDDLCRIRMHHDVAGVEGGLIPLSTKTHTVTFNASNPNGSADIFQNTLMSNHLPPVEFGQAFEFSPESNFIDRKLLKQKNNKVVNATEGISTSDDDIPAQYQSIFTYESVFQDFHKTPGDSGEEPEVAFGGATYLFLVLLSVFLLLFTFPITSLFCIKALTADGGRVEIGCLMVFHIVEAELAVNYWARDPRDLVLKKAQSALLAAVCRINWSDIVSGHALPDIACDVRASVNLCCSPYGIQILEVKLSEATSVQEPSVTSDRAYSIDFQNLGKQIASLSPLLTGGGSAGDSHTASVQFTAVISQIASLKLSQGNNSYTTTASMPISSVTDQASLEKVDEVIEQALSRGRVYLVNEKARAALGGTSLQVFVYTSDIRNKRDYAAAFYLDSDTGKGERGVLDFKKPSATIHINEVNLAGILDGRLDLLEALKNSQIRFAGSLLALSRLRFLLQFQ